MDRLKQHEVFVLDLMIEEFRSSRLVVVVGEKTGGRGVRLVESQNCEWYRVFCGLFVRRRRNRLLRRARTIIRRRTTLLALGRLAAGRVDSVYASRLLPLVRERASRETTFVFVFVPAVDEF